MPSRIVVVRKWGNSLGAAFPSDMVKEEMLGPNDRVIMTVKKVAPLKELFGSLKNKKLTAKIMTEIRRGWD